MDDNPSVNDEKPVLLNVEDFEPARFLRTRILSAAGFEVVEAATGEQAMTALGSTRPAVALVDVELPDTNGFDLCSRLKQHDPSLPILLISAVHVSARASDGSRNVGAAAYLREPVQPDLLVSRVCQALEGIDDEASLNWVITDDTGTILEASEAAGDMLHLSPAHLARRSLLMFFAADRDSWLVSMHSARRGLLMRRPGTLRPLDRRPLEVEVEISRAEDHPRAGTLLWTFGGLRSHKTRGSHAPGPRPKRQRQPED
jgi:DNA-binding response OmpR family regulator